MFVNLNSSTQVSYFVLDPYLSLDNWSVCPSHFPKQKLEVTASFHFLLNSEILVGSNLCVEGKSGPAWPGNE